MDEIRKAAIAYLAAGLSVIPCRRADKRPTIAWKPYQQQQMSAGSVGRHFDPAGTGTDAIGVVCGSVSGGVEMIDFDLGGEAFDAWRSLVEAAAPGLLDRLFMERTQSGGLHVAYRLQGEVPGNAKLAERRIETRGPEPIRLGSRPYTPRREGERWFVQVALIETRGEGGMFLAHPSDGYEVVQGSLEDLPRLTQDERDLLIGAAGSLTECLAAIEDDRPIGVGVVQADRPGDDFNRRGEIGEVLRRHGWTLAGTFDGQQHWRRPGKDTGTSATLRDGVLYVFSSSAAPFEPNRGYSRFAVFATLEHGGDYTAAAASLAEQGYGTASRDNFADIDLTGILAADPAVSSGGGGGVEASRAISYRVLVESAPSLRPVVIDGLLREGETANIIASPKVGKSWLTIDLAMAVATGSPWLGRFSTRKGRVLLLDNELHRETSANRFPRVAEARGIDEAQLYESLWIDNLRGRLLDFHRLRPYLESIPRGWYRLIVLDAFYRFLPNEVDENANGDMARVYSLIDYWADRLGSSFVLVHHASKGSQSGKVVTDVGAGAGAQSRATDTHIVLRPHEEDGVVVLDAAVRSFPPVEPICLNWRFPCFDPAPELDASMLRQENGRRRKPAESAEAAWTPERFVREFVHGDEQQSRIEARAAAAGLSERAAKSLLKQAIATGRLMEGSKRYHWVPVGGPSR